MSASGGAVAAVDLGATSGRVILGRFQGGAISMETVGRFPNTPVRTPSGLHWDLIGLHRGALDGLSRAFRSEPAIASIGVDSWAVDYALMRGDRMLGVPFHYRDERTASGVEAVHAVAPFEELYRRNGLQFLPFNTLYQLAAEGELLGLADGLLLVPDLIGWMLTGARVAERTNASTTGLLDVRTREWDLALAERIGVPAGILPSLVDPGTELGVLLPHVAAELGGQAPVVAVGSHDTASAVVAVPMRADRAAYISCGTWGLVGVETEHPVLTDAAREANFTNEGGVDGRVRFLHNVMGLWLLSESVRAWEDESGRDIDLPDLLKQAAHAPAPDAVFDANDAVFLAPGDMPARIAAWLSERGLAVPPSRPAFARLIVESLAEAFAKAVRKASELSGVPVETIHVVGGGALNTLLCQRLADRAGLPVLAGPVEATAIGNLLVQARTAGFVSGDLEALRAVVAGAFEPLRYVPAASRVRA
ncbi:rhamnulokinase [Microbacterium paludicola]|uniref:Rhamnulokinase n=1 Tax=Microbacterium paludicola TaxID=300019 RepID=A0A4Y9FZH7_9MICO|nr:rhamnulokinase family protein [Microbacterium paludicola]MBF0815126.1 rhamnulokinase [Microbacterium paludicola]TFU34394.1 rhamnulokinase [Microbacterium paludicola]